MSGEYWPAWKALGDSGSTKLSQNDKFGLLNRAWNFYQAYLNNSASQFNSSTDEDFPPLTPATDPPRSVESCANEQLPFESTVVPVFP